MEADASLCKRNVRSIQWEELSSFSRGTDDTKSSLEAQYFLHEVNKIDPMWKYEPPVKLHILIHASTFLNTIERSNLLTLQLGCSWEFLNHSKAVYPFYKELVGAVSRLVNREHLTEGKVPGRSSFIGESSRDAWGDYCAKFLKSVAGPSVINT